MAAVDVLILEQARKEVKEAIKDMTELNAKIIEIANNINKFTGKPFTNPIPSDLPKRAGESSKWISELNAANREAERLAGNVARSKARLAAAESANAKQLARLREETRLNNIALKEEGILSSKLVGAYRKLTVRREQAARTLKDLIASEKASNREIKRAQREFDLLDAKVRKADRATNDFRRNVGNYSSAFGKASLALRNFVGVLGIYSGFEVARQVFEQVKAINGLNLALQQVTETSQAYNEAQQFISDLAEEAGADVFELTSAYTKFLASAKTTTLTLEQTNNIFRQTAKAAGVLGLSTEDTNGAFRALEQILSKGKVQAEEIRGQLGERLPGAFQILAKSMGLTTAELSKQLELGNVLSDEVLPGFADELERTYNLGLVDRVETLAASQTRLGNAWKEFLANVEGGEGVISSVFKDIFDGITNALNALIEFNKTFGDKQLEGEAKGVKTAITAVKEESEKMNISFKDAAQNIIPRYKKIVSEWGEELSKVTQEQSKSVLTNFLNVLSGEFDEQEKTAKRAGEQMALYGKALETLEKIVQTGKLPEETNKNTNALKKGNKETDKAKTILAGSVAAYQKIISELKDKQSRLATTNEEYEDYNKQIEEAEKNVEKLTRALVDLSNVKDVDASAFGASELDLGIQEDFAQGFEKRQKERADKEILLEKQKQEVLKALREGELRNVEFLTNEQTKLVREALNLRLNLQRDFEDAKADLVLGSIDSLFQARITDIDREIEASQRRFDSITNFDEMTEEQKQATRKKFEQEQARLQKEKEKRERQGFLVQQGLAIAEIAINLARTISTINAAAAAFALPPPFGLGPIAGPPAGIVYASANIPIAIGTAAAQTGFVLAQTIPQLEKGAENFEGGPAIINDAKGNRFQEIVHTPDGKMYMSNTRNSLVNIPKGSNVYDAEKTHEILKNGFIKSNNNQQEAIDLWILRKMATKEISTLGIENVLKKELSKQAKRPIVVNVKQSDNYSRY